MKGTPTELQWTDYTPVAARGFGCRARSGRQNIIAKLVLGWRSAGAYLIAHVCMICLAAYPTLSQTGRAVLPPVGQVGDVVCDADATQSYALYLPSAYTPTKRWPIIYFFDPGGRGRRPLDLYKDVAEKYGFVIAGSNNSRNFGPDESKSLNAIWQDTHLRFSLDPRLTYVSGFSGGARVAGAMALSCLHCQIAGVIAHGAGYPTHRGEANDKLFYFFAVGNQDFNWSEVVTIRREREDKGLPYRVHVFSGPHQWAPAPVMEDAVEWLTLRAMQAGDRPPDAAFIDRLWSRMHAEADDAEKKSDAIAQLNVYRGLVSDFTGLRDMTEAEKKLTALKKSPALKAALKNEQEQISDQSALENEVSIKMQTYVSGAAEDSIALGSDILQMMRQLSDRAEHSKNETKRSVARRALDGLWVAGIERGEQELESRHFEKAEACFDLMSKVRNEPWPKLMLAETHAAAGNRKLAVKDLEEAVRRGLTDAGVIESNEKLQVLKGDPEFLKLVEKLKKR